MESKDWGNNFWQCIYLLLIEFVGVFERFPIILFGIQFKMLFSYLSISEWCLHLYAKLVINYIIRKNNFLPSMILVGRFKAMHFYSRIKIHIDYWMDCSWKKNRKKINISKCSVSLFRNIKVFFFVLDISDTFFQEL